MGGVILLDFSEHRLPTLGTVTLAAEGDALVGLWLEGQKYFFSSYKGVLTRNDSNPTLLAAKEWLNRYIAGEQPSISELKLAPKGSDFRQKVWQMLCKIPYGEVTTYGRIAEIIAKDKGMKSMSAQAVGNAVGHNPISIIIPCHRVIGADGSLTGYAGGIDKKIFLLSHEGFDVKSQKVPRK